MSDYTHEIVQAIGFLSSEMTETRCQLRQALQDISDALNVPTPKRVRNEAAVCGNCTYSVTFGNAKVLCRFEHPSAEHGFPVREDTEVCGEHQDFWREA